MIFVTVGMSDFPFDRLLEAVDDLPELVHSLVVQIGPSAVRPARAVCHPFLSFADLTAYMQSADVVVAHAGVGSVLLALAAGTPLLVVPRRKEFGEAIDDHQPLFAAHLRDADLACVVDPSELSEAVARVRSRDEGREAIAPVQSLAIEVADYLQHRLGAITARSAPHTHGSSRRLRRIPH
jgi:UDP-N-acetylglucosamine transferase subunit ALG13